MRKTQRFFRIVWRINAIMILAIAAVSAPEVMVKLVTPTIECFAELAHHEREILFDTFRVWVENDGSLRVVGELLFCHRNTVRHR